MKLEKVVVGDYQVNCYLLRIDKEVLVIDPGAEPKKIMSKIKPEEKIVGIVLTHGHFDHIGAVDELAIRYECPIYISEKDRDLIRNKKINSVGFLSAEIKRDTEKLPAGLWKCGSFNFKNYEAPGHTKGSMLLFIENSLFTGDVLFQRSIGRTDLFGGSDKEMEQTLEMIRSFNPKTLVYPGHGDFSTIEDEVKYNPYL